jgi:hypothetical protein
MSTRVDPTAFRPPGRGAMGCVGLASSSAARSKPWWDRGSLSALMSIGGFVVLAALPSTKPWAWWGGVHSSACTRLGRLESQQFRLTPLIALACSDGHVVWEHTDAPWDTHQVTAGRTLVDVAPSREEITRRVAAVAAVRGWCWAWRRPLCRRVPRVPESFGRSKGASGAA